VAGRMGYRAGEVTGSIGTSPRSPLGYASTPRGKALPLAVAGED